VLRLLRMDCDGAGGQAYGFRLTSLARLSGARSTNSNVTLLQYITQFIAKRNPKAL
jgi:hypothetical protein